MVTSYYIMKMNKKTFSMEEMEEYYSGLHSMSLAAFCKLKKSKTRCRACLQNGDIPFTSLTNPSEIMEALISIGNINIDDDDDQFPTYLCNTCYKFLKCAILFRKVAHRANITLRQPIMKDDKCNQINAHEDSECKEESEENGIKVQCPICEEIINSSYSMHLHQHNLLQLEKDLGNDDTIVQCPNETISQQHVPNLIDEVLFLQEEPKDDSTKVQCPICEEFLSKSSYKSHLQQHNPDKLKDSLQELGLQPLPDHLKDHEYFSILEELNEDEKSSTREPEDNVEDQQLHDHLNNSDYLGTFGDQVNSTEDFQCENEPIAKDTKVRCPKCKKVIFKSSYEIHLQEHKVNLSNRKKKPNNQIQQTFKTQNLWPICKICKKVISPPYYKTHLLLHNPNPPVQYMCEICGRIFKVRSSYINHRKRHETSYIYKCKLCPFESYIKNSLQAHMVSHGELRHLCPHCPARYVSGSILNTHIRKKHTQPQYKCDSCDKAFFNKLNLSRHINVAHLGIKSHECNICGTAFGYRRSMLKHQQHVHKTAKLKQIFSKSTYRPVTNDS